MLKNKQVIGGLGIAVFLAVVTLLGTASETSPFINSASAGYDGSRSSNSGSKTALVCHDGKTKRVAISVLKTRLAQGDTKGACKSSTTQVSTSDQKKVIELQKQLITLLQQFINYLKLQK